MRRIAKLFVEQRSCLLRRSRLSRHVAAIGRDSRKPFRSEGDARVQPPISCDTPFATSWLNSKPSWLNSKPWVLLTDLFAGQAHCARRSGPRSS
jgi:hypothetical protein